MKKSWKRKLSFLCAAALLGGMVPEAAFATEAQDTQETSETESSQIQQEETESSEQESSAYTASEETISDIADEITVLNDEKNKIEITADNSQRYFTVSVQNIDVDDLKSVSIAVWSDKNGQDDVRWYPAEQQKDGSWQMTVDIKNHKSDTGKYYAHVYVNTNRNTSQLIGGKTFDVEGLRKGQMQALTVNKDEGTYRIEVSGDLTPASVSKVVIPIWSEKNGQDDLVWYTASKSGDTWYVDLDISNHKYDTGIYYAHAYVTDSRGVEALVKGITFATSDMKKDILDVQLNASQTEAKITLKNFTTDADRVTFPVWGNVNGQNDIFWYPAKKVDAHTYTATVKISSHKETGSYSVHAYYSKNGQSTFVGSASFNVTRMSGAELNVAHQEDGTGMFEISISNLKSPAAIKNVSVAVWSDANGQDDLRWYTASNKNGVWSAHVDVVNHKMNTGKYTVHVYAEDARGISQIVAYKSINVSAVNVKPSVKAAVNEDAGKVEITVSNVLNASRVQIPVWGNTNGQNDVNWYDASKTGDRTWTATVELGNHMETGLYNVHVYATVNNKSSLICNTTFNVSKIAANVISIYNKNDEYGRFSVKIQNVANVSKVKRVWMAVWSVKDGQDDIHWYLAKKDGNSWYADVDCVNHLYDSGTYVVHIYIENSSGQMKLVNSTNVEVKISGKYGFVKSGSKVYYYERPGVMIKGFKELNGFTYYFNEKTGVMATGWTYINGYKYYFENNGHRVDDLTNILGTQSSYKLLVNKQMNVATMYTYDAATGTYCIPVKSMRCATGKPTPLGTFNLSQTYRWLLMYNGTYCQYCTLITGDYLLHSIVYFRRGDIYSMQSEGYNGLAMRVGQSAGCVRFQCGNAYWFYNLVNAGRLRQVTIYNSSDYGPYGLPYVAPIPGNQTWDPTDPLI